MAISKAVRSALKALSYPSDIDVEKSYRLERRLKMATGKPLLYNAWDHLVWGGDHEIPVRIFTPPTGGLHDLLIFFHGGGWVTGNIDSYTTICQNMARITNRTIASVDYRLAPEYRFPAAPEDCFAAAREICLRCSLLGADPAHIALIGDSAGGNLAAAVSLMLRDRGEFSPAMQILLYPATHYDHTENSPFDSIRENGTDYLLTSKRICEYMALYQSSDEDQKNPYFAPLLAPDLSGLPRTLILTAEYDPLRDEGEAFGEALQKAGTQTEVHRMPDALHGFLSLPPRFSQVRDAYALINRFLRSARPGPGGRGAPLRNGSFPAGPAASGKGGAPDDR